MISAIALTLIYVTHLQLMGKKMVTDQAGQTKLWLLLLFNKTFTVFYSFFLNHVRQIQCYQVVKILLQRSPDIATHPSITVETSRTFTRLNIHIQEHGMCCMLPVLGTMLTSLSMLLADKKSVIGNIFLQTCTLSFYSFACSGSFWEELVFKNRNLPLFY